MIWARVLQIHNYFFSKLYAGTSLSTTTTSLLEWFSAYLATCFQWYIAPSCQYRWTVRWVLMRRYTTHWSSLSVISASNTSTVEQRRPSYVWITPSGTTRTSTVKVRGDHISSDGATNTIVQRFSNWGPQTKGGPRRVPRRSARGFPKIVIVCTVLTIYDSYVFKFAHITLLISTSITLKLLAIHCNFYVTDDVDRPTFVKSGVHKNLDIL